MSSARGVSAYFARYYSVNVRSMCLTVKWHCIHHVAFVPTDPSGKDSFDHVGNKLFRELIEKHIASYLEASSRHEKSTIVSKIYDHIRHKARKPSTGFVRKVRTPQRIEFMAFFVDLRLTNDLLLYQRIFLPDDGLLSTRKKHVIKLDKHCVTQSRLFDQPPVNQSPIRLHSTI